MRNFSDAQNAVQTALNSTNSAIEENGRYMESITAKLNALKAEYEKFILGNGGLEAFEKKMLDTGLSVMQFINNIGGLSTVLTALTTLIGVTLLSKFDAFEKSLHGVYTNIAQLITDFIDCKKAGFTFAETLEYVGVTASTTQLALQGIVAAVGIAITLFNAYQQKQRELADEAHKTVSSTLDQVDAINMQLVALKKENQSREDLVKAIQAVDGAYKDEGQRLDEINKKRQESIDKLKEETQVSLEKAQREGYTQYRKDRKTLDTGYSSQEWQDDAKRLGVNYNVDNLGDTIKTLEAIRNKLQDLNQTTEVYDGWIEKLQSEYDEAKAGVEEYDSVLLALGKVYDTVSGKIRTLIPAEINHNQSTQESIELTEQQSGILEDLGTSIEQLQEILTDGDMEKLQELLSVGDIEGIIELLQSYGIELDNIADSTNDVSDIWDEYLDNIEGVQSAYETLIKAADEYNKNGFITASTLKKLNKLEPEYLASLYKEGDMYANINEDLGKYLEKEKADAKVKVEIARVTALLEVAQNALNGETDKSKTAVDNFATAASNASDDVAQLKGLTAQLAIAMSAVRNQGKLDDNLISQLNGINDYFNNVSKNIDAVMLGAVESTKSAASSSKDAWVEAFEEEQRQLKHSLEMGEITELEYYERLKDLNEKYFGEISGNHQKYIKEYQENEEEIYKGTKAVYDKVKDYLKEAVEQGYERAINALKKEEKAVLAEIKSQIESLKREKKAVLDGIKDQINALKKQKEQVQKYYNDQIDAIKKENEVLQEQNQLLEYQQQLQQAKAQKVMVMQDGKFQLGENESAVAQAEQNLNNYKDQLSYEQQIQQLEELRDAQVEAIEARIQSLEEYYEYMENYYDRQIEAMEDYYDRVQEQYEKQIEALQEELDTFKEGYQKVEDLENARLAAQVLGINERALLYEQDLENLKNYINATNTMLESLGEAGVLVGHDYSPSTASHSNIAKIGEVEATLQGRASGDASFKGNEVALVGESPNTELVLGSRLNHSLGGGELVHLSKGSGVVNAESTRTLAGLLNGLANPQSVSSSRTMQQTFTFGSISLPNVTNAETFVGALRDKFNNYSIQSTTIKK